MDLVPPSEHQVLVFLAAYLVLLVAARGLGALAQRIGQPAVVGELAAGLVLGPSVLGRVLPDVEDWLFPSDLVQTGMLFTVAWLGVIFLLLGTGFETDLGLIRRQGRAAAIVSTGSLVVPVAGGLVVGALMPSLFLGVAERTEFALFMGAALSISSLPVIAKILSDMGYMRRNVGQLTLAAGMANDVVGWVALGIIAGLVSAGSITVSGVATTILGIAAFFLFALTIGQRLVDRALRTLRRVDADASTRTTVLVAITLAGAFATQWLGVEAVLGAFVVGIVVGRSPYRDASVLHSIETASAGFLAPVFFATAGLRVDLGLLADGTVLAWAGVVLAVAALTKFLGALAAGALARLPHRESAALGVALNARGALEIVIASVGLALGVLNDASYTVVVLMAMATSMMAPPLLRAVLQGWPGTAEEQERLKREHAQQTNVVVRADRVLFPVLDSSAAPLAAQVIDLAWPVEAPVTILTTTPPGEGNGADPVVAAFAERDITMELAPDGDFVDAVVAEAKLGYGAIVVGIGEHLPKGELPAGVAAILSRTDIPVVIVRRPKGLRRLTPSFFGRALVPVAGSRTARAAQEVAFGVSGTIGTETVLAHISHERSMWERAPHVAAEVLNQASGQGIDVGARVQTIERPGTSPGAEIVTLAEEVAADLVVVGATQRSAAETQFLGQTTTRILRDCRATVVAVVLPAPDAPANGPTTGSTPQVS
jgi:Kef-type K+ transport system membrane component KefB/nucleotide-binding universal stress UspA family protein